MSAAQQGRLPPELDPQIKLFAPAEPGGTDLDALGYIPGASGWQDGNFTRLDCLCDALAAELADPAEISPLPKELVIDRLSVVDCHDPGAVIEKSPVEVSGDYSSVSSLVTVSVPSSAIVSSFVASCRRELLMASSP